MQIPLFEPQSLWRPPAILPTLSGTIAVDLETYDPEIKKDGPGYKTGNGKVVGIALADKHQTVYLPYDHFGGDNLDKDTVISYTRSVIQNASELVMANATYDLGWLTRTGVTTSKTIRDIQVGEALIDEEKFSYSLDSIAKKYLKKGKKEDGLQTAADAYGISAKSDMWKLPARHVGKYAEADARLTYDAYQKQIPILREQGLWEVWELESKLIHVLVYMSMKGVPVDLDAAEQFNKDLKIKEVELLAEFKNLDIWSPQQLGKYIENLGLKVPRTDKGNYSVAKDFFTHCEHPQVRKIQEARSINRLRKVFIEDIILNRNYNGRIHADFRQTASDEGGTRSGRLSSSNPNMQQVPKRSDIGKRIRSLYIAEPDRLWCKADYSSQEPRLQVHYALLGEFGRPLPRSQEALESFKNGEKLYTFFEKATGLPYDTCKMLCLGISYGMGIKKMARTLGISDEVCQSTMRKFNKEAPFLKILFDNVMNLANKRGYIKTILGRRARFDFWTHSFDETPVRHYGHAKSKWQDKEIFRAFTSKALNRLIQGSAADQAKVAMVNAYEAGIDLRLPVHDEINAMVKNKEESDKLKEIMEQAIPLKVPVIADIDLGSTWC